MLGTIRFLTGCIIWYVLLMVATLLLLAVFPTFAPHSLDALYRDFGQWWPDAIGTGTGLAWTIGFFGPALLNVLTEHVLREHAQDARAASILTTALTKAFKLNEKPRTVEKTIDVIAAELELSGDEVDSTRRHLDTLLQNLRRSAAKLGSLDGITARIQNDHEAVAQAEALLNASREHETELNRGLAALAQRVHPLRDDMETIALHLRDLEELEAEISKLDRTLGADGVDGVLARLSRLDTRFRDTLPRLEALSENPLQDGTGLEEFLRNRKDELEGTTDLGDLQNHIDELERLEGEVTKIRTLLETHSGLFERFKALRDDIDRITEIDDRIWRDIDGEGSGIEDALEELTEKLEEANQRGLEDQLAALEEVETGVRTIGDTIIAAADRIRDRQHTATGVTEE